MADTPTTETTTTPAPPPVDTPQADASTQQPKTYTQEEVDKMIDRRLTRERQKFGDYEDLKAKASRLGELEEAGKTETEKLRSAVDKANRERDEALTRSKATLLRAAIVAAASKLGAVDPQAVAALLPRDGITVDGEEIEGVEEAVKQFLIEKPYLKATGASRAGTELGGGTSGQPQQFKRSQLRDPKFYRDNQQAIEAAARAGRILDDIGK